MKPTIGRVVHYKLSEQDKKDLEGANRLGFVSCNTRPEVLPAVIVAVWSDTCVNLQVSLDGNKSFWKTSVQEGDLESNWHWPVIVKEG